MMNLFANMQIIYFSDCTSYSPAATTIFLIFLLFESLLFGIFTAIMFGTQLSAICSDETVSISPVFSQRFTYVGVLKQKNVWGTKQKSPLSEIFTRHYAKSYIEKNGILFGEMDVIYMVKLTSCKIIECDQENIYLVLLLSDRVLRIKKFTKVYYCSNSICKLSHCHK